MLRSRKFFTTFKPGIKKNFIGNKSVSMESLTSNQNLKEDSRWIEQVYKGQERAFEKLVQKYQRMIYSLVRKMVIGHDETNDIVQDTFVKAYLSLKDFDETLPFYPWLRRIAINTTLNFVEKKRRYQQTFQREDERLDVPVTNGNPLKQLISQERQQQIATALENLPIEQRMVFVLKVAEELSYQEISERLNISVGTVMSRLFRARERLKKLLRSDLKQNDIEG